MSYILKISYQHRHKKYRYNCDKPVNFNQIRTQLGISHSHQSLLYVVQSADMSFSVQNMQKEDTGLTFKEQELTNYLKTVSLAPKQMLKIKVTSKEQTGETQKMESDFDVEGDEGSLPLKLQNIKSRSEEIDIEQKGKGSVSNTIELTQSFFCNSLLHDLMAKKSKQLSELEQQLNRNSLRLRLCEQKKRYSNIQKIYQYWSSIK